MVELISKIIKVVFYIALGIITFKAFIVALCALFMLAAMFYAFAISKTGIFSLILLIIFTLMVLTVCSMFFWSIKTLFFK